MSSVGYDELIDKVVGAGMSAAISSRAWRSHADPASRLGIFSRWTGVFLSALYEEFPQGSGPAQAARSASRMAMLAMAGDAVVCSAYKAAGARDIGMLGPLGAKAMLEEIWSCSPREEAREWIVDGMFGWTRGRAERWETNALKAYEAEPWAERASSVVKQFEAEGIDLGAFAQRRSGLSARIPGGLEELVVAYERRAGVLRWKQRRAREEGAGPMQARAAALQEAGEFGAWAGVLESRRKAMAGASGRRWYEDRMADVARSAMQGAILGGAEGAVLCERGLAAMEAAGRGWVPEDAQAGAELAAGVGRYYFREWIGALATASRSGARAESLDALAMGCARMSKVALCGMDAGDGAPWESSGEREARELVELMWAAMSGLPSWSERAEQWSAAAGLDPAAALARRARMPEASRLEWACASFAKAALEVLGNGVCQQRHVDAFESAARMANEGRASQAPRARESLLFMRQGMALASRHLGETMQGGAWESLSWARALLGCEDWRLASSETVMGKIDAVSSRLASCSAWRGRASQDFCSAVARELATSRRSILAGLEAGELEDVLAAANGASTTKRL